MRKTLTLGFLFFIMGSVFHNNPIMTYKGSVSQLTISLDTKRQLKRFCRERNVFLSGFADIALRRMMASVESGEVDVARLGVSKMYSLKSLK